MFTWKDTMLVAVAGLIFLCLTSPIRANEITNAAKDLIKETEYYAHVSDYIKSNPKLKYSASAINVLAEEEIGLKLTDNLEFLANSDGDYQIKFTKEF